MQKLSAVIISKNEGDRIGRCIQSLEGLVTDIIVVDSGSTDDTIEIAENLGARIIETEWKGYGPTKNFGHQHAEHDWILSLDSDEYLTEKLKAEIQGLELLPKHIYAINRKNFYLGQRINHSGWSPDWVQRVFNKADVKWNSSLVHERLIVPSDHKSKRLSSFLNHDSYRSKQDHISKSDKYAKLKAETWIKQGNGPSLAKRWFGAEFKSVQSYILKLGFLDGKAGLELAKMNSYLVKKQFEYYDELKNIEGK